MAESLYQGKMDWGITNDLKVQKCMSNAPVLDVELVNGATYTIKTAELRGKGSNGGAIAKESLGQNSFRSFVVSDPQNTAHKPLVTSTKVTAQTTRKTTASLLIVAQ